MGIQNYTKLSKDLTNIKMDNKLKSYIIERESGSMFKFAISDYSYVSISISNGKMYDISAPNITESTDQLFKQLLDKGSFPKWIVNNRNNKNYRYINVYDPLNRYAKDKKINRSDNRQYSNFLFEYPMKPNNIKCLGNFFDYIISFFIIKCNLSKETICNLRSGKYELLNTKLLKNKCKRITFPTTMSKYQNRIKNISSKLVKLTSDRFDLLNYLKKIMPNLYFKRFLYVLKICSCLDSSMIDYKNNSIYTLKFDLSYKNEEWDFDVNELDDNIYDKHSITQIKNIKGYNIIKDICYNILKQRKIIKDHIYNIDGDHLNIYSDGIEADWIIISLTHCLRYTKIYTKDSDILVLGQSDTFFKLTKSNNKMLIMYILSNMCKKQCTDKTVIYILILLFSTGSDYIKHKGFGKVEFINTIKSISNFIFHSKQSKFDILDIINEFMYKKSLDNKNSFNYIYDSIVAIVKCLNFYWDYDNVQCDCKSCSMLYSKGIDI